MFSKTSSVSIITTNDQNIEFSEIIHVLTNAILTQLDNPTWVISGVATGTRIPDPPFFLIWSLPRLWYGSLSGSISLNHLSIFYNISCYNSLVLLTFVSMSSCRITYIYIATIDATTHLRAQTNQQKKICYIL